MATLSSEWEECVSCDVCVGPDGHDSEGNLSVELLVLL